MTATAKLKYAESLTVQAGYPHRLPRRPYSPICPPNPTHPNPGATMTTATTETATAAVIYTLPNDLSEYGVDLVTRYRGADGEWDGHEYDWRRVDVAPGDITEHGVWLFDADTVVGQLGFRAVTGWHQEDSPAGVALVADVEAR